MNDHSLEFLTAALDPFHDRKVSFHGLPDASNEETICEEIRHSITISAPILDPGATTWSAVVFTTPLDNVVTTYPCQGGIGNTIHYGEYVTTPGFKGYRDTTIKLGSVNAHTWGHDNAIFFPKTGENYQVPASVFADFVLAPPANSNVLTFPVKPQPTLRYRVVASGFEITNTTADIYRQGTATCSRTSSSISEHENIYSCQPYSTATLNQPFDFQAVAQTPNIMDADYIFCQPPPATLADALEAGAIQWHASEGAYSVSLYDQEKNQLSNARFRQYAATTEDCTEDIDPAFTPTNINALASLRWRQSNDSANPNMISNQYCSTQSIHISPRDNCAVYLTGLSPQTTFTLTMRYYVESAPRVQDLAYQMLVPLKQPSPLMDENALLIYQRASSKMPPAVPVGENFSGNFWSGLMGVIKDVVPIAGAVAGALGVPGAAAVASVASKALELIAPNKSPPGHVVAIARPQKKKKPKVKVNNSRPSSTNSRKGILKK